VSAVTHELRAPLATFQLYSEMLADDMVPDARRRRDILRFAMNRRGSRTSSKTCCPLHVSSVGARPRVVNK